MHRDDVAMGWRQRMVYVSSKTPAGHGFTLNGCFSPMKDIICDHCGEPITGQVVVACTRWRSSEGMEPGQWESGYGEIIPESAVKVMDALVGGGK